MWGRMLVDLVICKGAEGDDVGVEDEGLGVYGSFYHHIFNFYFIYYQIIFFFFYVIMFDNFIDNITLSAVNLL